GIRGGGVDRGRSLESVAVSRSGGVARAGAGRRPRRAGGPGLGEAPLPGAGGEDEERGGVAGRRRLRGARSCDRGALVWCSALGGAFGRSRSGRGRWRGGGPPSDGQPAGPGRGLAGFGGAGNGRGGPLRRPSSFKPTWRNR